MANNNPLSFSNMARNLLSPINPVLGSAVSFGSSLIDRFRKPQQAPAQPQVAPMVNLPQPAPQQAQITRPQPRVAPTPTLQTNQTATRPTIPAIQQTQETAPTLNLQGSTTQQATQNAPAIPAIPTEAQKVYNEANKAYEQSLKVSPEELSTQEDIDRLIQSAKTAYTNTQNQAIPLEFITGQLAAVERRATGLMEPLERKLARLEATRKGALEASKFALDRSRATMEAEKAQTAPQTIAEGSQIIRLNPQTGKYETVFSRPKEAAKPASVQEYEYAKSQGYQGTFSQYQTEDANRKRSVTNISTGGAGSISPTAQNIIDLVNKGANMDDLIKGTSKEAQALRNEVIRGIAQQGGRTTQSTDLLQEGKTIVDDLLNTKGYKALGGYSTLIGGQFSQSYGDASAKAQQLAAILSRDNLGLLKGAMSDKDIAFIQSMSTGFEGQGIQSETYLKNRLAEIQKKLQNKLNQAPANQPEQPQDADYANYLKSIGQ